MITIIIASDHAGYDLKTALIPILQEKGYKVIDLGCSSRARADYPDYAHRVAQTLQDQEDPKNAQDAQEERVQFGILICGSGIGMSIAANRHRGIRAALVQTPIQAALARAHNNANVLCLGARFLTLAEAKACATTFLSTPFEGGRHKGRVQMLDL